MREKTPEKTSENAPGKRQHWRAGNMLYPLPAVMVSCAREGGNPNIITVAWAGTICSDPAMVSISVRPERYSYDIIRETGEFVINLTTEALTHTRPTTAACAPGGMWTNSGKWDLRRERRSI